MLWGQVGWMIIISELNWWLFIRNWHEHNIIYNQTGIFCRVNCVCDAEGLSGMSGCRWHICHWLHRVSKNCSSHPVWHHWHKSYWFLMSIAWSHRFCGLVCPWLCTLQPNSFDTPNSADLWQRVRLCYIELSHFSVGELHYDSVYFFEFESILLTTGPPKKRP